jgi:hypothetical protein
VEINGVSYVAEPIDPHEEGIAALRLSKMSGEGEVYDLVRRHDGRITCDCPHYTARIEGFSEDSCKHGRAAAELGLLPAPKPSLSPIGEKPAPLPRHALAHPAAAPGVPDPRLITSSDRAASAVFGIKLPDPAPGPCCAAREAAPCVACAPTPAASVPTLEGQDGAPEARDDAPGIDPAEAAADRLTLAQLIAAEIARLRSWGSDAGDLLTDHLGVLLAEVETPRADTVAVLRDRRDDIPVDA